MQSLFSSFFDVAPDDRRSGALTTAAALFPSTIVPSLPSSARVQLHHTAATLLGGGGGGLVQLPVGGSVGSSGAAPRCVLNRVKSSFISAEAAATAGAPGAAAEAGNTAPPPPNPLGPPPPGGAVVASSQSGPTPSSATPTAGPSPASAPKPENSPPGGKPPPAPEMDFTKSPESGRLVPFTFSTQPLPGFGTVNALMAAERERQRHEDETHEEMIQFFALGLFLWAAGLHIIVYRTANWTYEKAKGLQKFVRKVGLWGREVRGGCL